MRSVYVIGEPASGKSTATRKWIGTGVPVVGLGLQATLHMAGILQLGAHHDTFPGTDRLSMGVMPKALDLVASMPCNYLYAEGDRLAARKFLNALAEAGDTAIIHMHADQATLDERRKARGRVPDAQWLAGRATKVQNLLDYADKTGIPVYSICTDDNPDPAFPIESWPI